MVIKNVAFAETVTDNSIKVRVQDNYCGIRAGQWKLRFDSIAVHVTSPIISQFNLGCSLMQSLQLQNNTVVLANTPLHLITIQQTGDPLAFPIKIQLLGPGNQSSWYDFCHGSQEFSLSFTEVGPRNPRGSQLTGLFVAGIISFEEM